MKRYRKKPVEIEAMQVPRCGEYSKVHELRDWLNESGRDWWPLGENNLRITTLEGDMTASPGDWIIKGVEGEIYPCHDSIFQATYEEVS